jgi:3-dehydroquinate synthase
MYKTVTVPLPGREYDILIGPGTLARLGEWTREHARAKRAVVITETNINPLYGEQALLAMAEGGAEAVSMSFPAGEVSKNLDTIGALLKAMFHLEPAIDRGTAVVGLGGGVATDMAGFVAAICLRGLRWIACPTSLLAAVDASVGGKTGVDHEQGKNLIGAFHQPSGVIIDVNTLRSLDRRELGNGLAECVKHAVIRDPVMLDELANGAADLQTVDEAGHLAFDAERMTELVARNVAIKAAVVAEDEKESGLRAILNFGHTVGHGVEALIGYDVIRHGEAVSLGMVAANRISVQRGLLDSATADRVEEVLGKLALPIRKGNLNFDAVWRIMQHDKKARDGRVRFVLARDLGDVAIYDDVTKDEVRAAVEYVSQP